MAPKCARSNGSEKWREKWGKILGLEIALRVKLYYIRFVRLIRMAKTIGKQISDLSELITNFGYDQNYN